MDRQADTILTDDGKEARLKRCYRRFQVVCAAIVMPMLVLGFGFPNYSKSHGGLMVLIFSGLGIGSALYLRSRTKREGIDPAELPSYFWRQPMMIVVAIIVAISVVVHLYQVFFPK